MNFLLIMKFWSTEPSCPDRMRNVSFCYPKMLKLGKYLQDNGVACEVKIYDFSKNQLIKEAIHRPYPSGCYMKAEKTNVVLNENKNFDYLCMFDCDTFFVEADFPKYLNILKNVKKNEIYTFDLAKVETTTALNYIDNPDYNLFNDYWWFAYAGPKATGPFGNGSMGALGGVYICDIELILQGGLFNPEITNWGGEDGDMLDRIWRLGVPFNCKSQKDFFPFHLPHPPVL